MTKGKKEYTRLLEYKEWAIDFDNHCYSMGKIDKKDDSKLIHPSYSTTLKHSLSLLKQELFKKNAKAKKYQSTMKSFDDLAALITRTENEFNKIIKAIGEL